MHKKGEELRKENFINRSKRRLEMMENKVRMTKEIKEKSQEYSQKINDLKQ